MNDLARLSLAAIAGLLTIQLCGLLNLLLGSLFGRWNAGATPCPNCCSATASVRSQPRSLSALPPGC